MTFFVQVSGQRLTGVTTDLDPRLSPFFHGVASGDPLSDRVILWTRITLDTLGPVSLNWVIATDTSLTQVVNSGVVATHDTLDYTVKVDAAGLNPETWYYYRFEYNGRYSLTGRTKTAPAGPVNHLRFGVMSCSNYEAGYFNTYRSLVDRNDLDALIHLGDYIYEYQVGGFGGNFRTHEPPNETITLEDYRIRYSHFHLDHDLRYAHQQYPWMIVWDDHETANDSWKDGAENHDPGSEGLWSDRKTAGIRAWSEWLPVRKPDANNIQRIYRKANYGDLVDILLLDTRLDGRDEQNQAAIDDTSRHLITKTQLNWLENELLDTSTTWKVLAQQVMIAPLVIGGTPFNKDQWDGYRADRNKLLDFVMSNNVQNMVVLTGDIHTAWANDIPLNGYDPGTGANSAGVEFVTTSVTSPGLPIPAGEVLVKLLNPHVKYVDLAKHGYYVLDLLPNKAQADYFALSTITDLNFTTDHQQSWYVNEGERHLRQSQTVAAGPPAQQDLAPVRPPNPPVGNDPLAGDDKGFVLMGSFPNPFYEELQLQFFLYKSMPLTLTISDLAGKVVFKENMPAQNAGLNYAQINLGQIADGTYILTLSSETGNWHNRIVKMK